MAKLDTYHSDHFTWNKGTGVSTLRDLNLNRWPSKGFYIRSAKTGATKLFLPDSERNEAMEFFDGEGMAFMSPGGGVTVQLWV